MIKHLQHYYNYVKDEGKISTLVCALATDGLVKFYLMAVASFNNEITRDEKALMIAPTAFKFAVFVWNFG